MIIVRHGQSEFNVVYSKTRVDPGIEDPAITELGAEQARDIVPHLKKLEIRRLISSPYRRALQTASIIADALSLDISVDPRVREHYAFSCDIGSPTSALAQEWPSIDFSHLADRWWPHEDETDEIVEARAKAFLSETQLMADRDHTAIVSHWGFIRGLTGLRVGNGTVVRVPQDGKGLVVAAPDP